MPDRASDFQMEQYKTLRKEIESNTEEIRTLQRYSVVAIGAVWAFIATHPKTQAWVAFLPVLFIVVGAFHSGLLVWDTQVLGYFIERHVEPFFLQNEPGVGWEGWLQSSPKIFTMTRALLKDPKVWANWGMLLLVTSGVAIAYGLGLIHLA